MAGIIAYPVIYSAVLSTRNLELTSGTGSDFVGLEQFKRVLSDPLYWQVLLNTAEFVVVAVSFELLLGLLIALALMKMRFGRDFARTILLAPMFVTPIAIGLLFRFLLDSQLGVVPALLGKVGITFPFFGAKSAIFSLAAIDVWQWTPFMILLILAGLQNLPQDPFEAASLDGASGFKLFRYITFPLMRPILVVAVLIRTLDATRVYEYVYAITQGGPGDSTQTLQYYVYKVAFSHYDFSQAAAIGWTAVIFIMALVILLLWRTGRAN